MSTYVRPPWPAAEFRDATGIAISYGSRWRSDGPPPESYSVVSHADRFAPLHVVADALVEHLQETYDARVTWDDSCAEDFLRAPDLERVARVTPNDPTAAPVTIGFTAFPGLLLHAGLLHDFAYPTCGCDACDETGVGQVERFESHLFTVVAGDYQETYTPGADLPLAFVLRSYETGEEAGSSTTDGYPTDRLVVAAAKLRGLPDGWVRWPLRSWSVPTSA